MEFSPVPKKPLASRRIWGLLIILLAQLLGAFDVDLDVKATNALIDTVFTNWETIMTFVGLVVSLWGQVKATQPIEFKRSK